MPRNHVSDTDTEISTENETGSDKDLLLEQTRSKKRIKSARDHLNSLVGLHTNDLTGNFDATNTSREAVAKRLKKESAMAKGSCIEEMATKIIFKLSNISCHRGRHCKPLTAVVAGSDGFVYTADKSSRIIKWNPNMTRNRELTLDRRTTVLCLAITQDASRLISGHLDGSIGIWDCRNGVLLHTLSQHRGAVYSLAFQMKNEAIIEQEDRLANFAQHGVLYSSSKDRTIKLWTIDDTPALLDTLYGHQDAIPAVDTVSKEQCISVGGHDGTVRLWNITDEAQLIYRPTQESSMQEMLAMMDEDSWVTASSCIGEDKKQASISLWVRHKKKPIAVVFIDSPITSLTALRFSDFIVTGHVDGSVRCWKADMKNRTIETVIKEPINLSGIVNSLFITKDAIYAACGSEPRLGRWMTRGNASRSNRLFRIPIEHS